MYIQGIGCISPQAGHQQDPFLESPLSYPGGGLQVVDPGYRNFIDPKLSRRMSKVIKMGVSAARLCLNDAKVEMPGSIITGTGLGCIEDTENFLGEIIRNKEQLLTPTPFIQSTHNTVAAQIALMLKCHATNFTYVHRGFSFELAMMDALMQLEEGTAENVLVGGVDELTPHAALILKRLGLIRNNPPESLDLFQHPGKGTVFGEGAAFFMMGSAKQDNSYARFTGVDLLLRPESGEEINAFILRFLEKCRMDSSGPDLILYGWNGDQQSDSVYGNIQKQLFPSVAAGGFKQLCGEYHTASSFAVWLASRILKEQRIPAIVSQQVPVSAQVRTVLVYNHFQGINHSVCLLQSC